MHTTKIEVIEQRHERDMRSGMVHSSVLVHNGDWSGTVRVIAPNGVQVAELPGELFKRASYVAAINDAVEALDRLI